MIETRTIALGTLRFTVDLAGPAGGQPVLLLHGFPETRHMWRPQMEALAAAGYRAIAPDQRGYSTGARPAALDAYRVERIVEDAVMLMHVLGIAQFHLVGHDWGGQIAWLVTARHSDKVRSLTVLSRPHPAAFVRAMEEDPDQSRRSRHHRAYREDSAVIEMRRAELRPIRAALIAQNVPAAFADIHVATLAEPGGIEGAMNWYRATGFAADDTPVITVPTLYVWGDKDSTVGRYAAELTRDYVTGAYRFVTLADAGHFLVDEFPDEVTALLLAHIAANS
ncbi:alpha/beta fold hydrolase [Niveispirillum sp.]|uniref:alpha/beta fold hydrolase n=1 Tax=Niveispirillum sp. TaxID=1917217 RepID=UPI001B627CCF|nr:alpha/beta hydrolase [Niveispirillum sp.]MBP7335290.1 alpha/beta hydrolase [Niveispirillum sp.]